MNKWTTVSLVILLFATYIRFTHFYQRILFGPEQALSLLVSAEQMRHFTLLGLPNLQRVTSDGHVLYSGSLFNYSLIPFLRVSPNPVIPTGFFALLILITGVLLWWLAKKTLGERVAVFALLFFLFDPIMIWHSTFIWILNYLPLIGTLSMYYLYKFTKTEQVTQQVWLAFIIGVLSGIGFNIQYMYVFTGFLVAILLFWFSQRKFTTLGLFSLGTVVGNLPMVVFDLRHDWYHFTTLLQYAQDTINTPGQHMISYYHFLHFWPFLATIAALIVDQIWQKQRWIATSAVCFFIIWSITSDTVNLTQPVGMPSGLTYDGYLRAAAAIAQDKPENFNVASTIAYDTTRAYPLRYLTTYIYGYTPKNETQYASIDQVYVLHSLSPPLTITPTNAWELTALGGNRVELLTPITNGYGVYKISKQ